MNEHKYYASCPSQSSMHIEGKWIYFHDGECHAAENRSHLSTLAGEPEMNRERTVR